MCSLGTPSGRTLECWDFYIFNSISVSSLPSYLFSGYRSIRILYFFTIPSACIYTEKSFAMFGTLVTSSQGRRILEFIEHTDPVAAVSRTSHDKMRVACLFCRSRKVRHSISMCAGIVLPQGHTCSSTSCPSASLHAEEIRLLTRLKGTLLRWWKAMPKMCSNGY